MSRQIRTALAGARRAWLLIAIASVVGCDSPRGAITPDSQAVKAQRPNLLFITTDDQRFDMLGVVNPLLRTPTMDRLALEGTRFEHAFVTTPICAASRASWLTGLVERTHQFTFGTPPLATRFTDQSYPVLLRQAGYRTGFIGKFGVNTEADPASALFDEFVPLSPAPYLKPQADGSTRHLTDITADHAVEFLRTRDPSRPFALTLSFNAPHADDGDERQFIWPEAMNDMYSDVTMPEPPLSDPAFFEALPEFLKDASLSRVRWHWRFDTPEKAQQMTRGYLRMISGVDAAVGRVLDELASLGLDSNTVVVLMGDNGYFLGERGYAGKWLPYDLSIRVPLIVFDPRLDDGRRGAVPTPFVLNIDIAPTLLDLAGVRVPETMQGTSLVPIIGGASPADWRRDIWVEHRFNHPEIPKHEGVRGEQYKYARYFEQDPVYEELYDLIADPMETINLAARADHADILAALRRRTDELLAEYSGR